MLSVLEDRRAEPCQMNPYHLLAGIATPDLLVLFTSSVPYISIGFTMYPYLLQMRLS